jgi:hypothetical protein
MSISRRSFLNTTPIVLVPALWGAAERGQAGGGAVAAKPNGPGDSFPTQPADLAREMVGVSHNNLARVKELLERQPTLARASYDWGFGDWEDALGAASHVGNREIADVLLKNGARPTIFSAAMLGQLETVKAFIAASPGIEATPGPHGITLLRHAMAGGAQAQAVLDYLKTLPGADSRPAAVPLSTDQLTALAGEYVYGAGPDERITVAVSTNANSSLTFARIGRSPRGLVHVGDNTFFPVGAPRVQIKFRRSTSGATITVHDPDLVMEAKRVVGSGLVF